MPNLSERTVQARGRHLQMISGLDDVAYVQKIADKPAHLSAVFHRDPLRLVDEEPQHPSWCFASVFHLDQFESFRFRDRFQQRPDGLDDPLLLVLSVYGHGPSAIPRM